MKHLKVFMPFLLMFVFSINISAQKLEQFIPKDASFVTSFNLNNLNNKVSLEKIQSYDFYKEGMKEMVNGMKREVGPEMTDAFQNPSKYGMDIMKETFLFGQMSKEGSYFGLIFNLNDQSKFAEFFTKNILPTAGGEMTTMNGYQTMVTNNAAIAWKDSIGIITGGTLNWNIDGEQKFDENTNEDHGKNEAAAVKGYLQRILKRNPVNSMLSHPKFAQSVAKKSDMKLWMDYKWFMKMQMQDSGRNFGGMGMGDMMNKMMDMYDGVSYTVDLNFNDGQMRMDSKMHAPQDMVNMWKKVGDRKLNKNFFKYLPKEGMMGYLTMALNMENMADEVGGMLDPMLAEMGTTVPEMEEEALKMMSSAGINLDRKGMYNLLKGDMVFAVTGMRDFVVKKTEYDEDFNRVEVDSKMKLPEFMMMASFGNEADIMKFVKVGMDAGMLGQEGNKNVYKLAIPTSEIPMDVYMAIHDGVLMFSNNDDLMKKKKGLKKGIKRKQRISKKDQLVMNNSGSMFYWDIPQTLNAAAQFAAAEGQLDGMTNKMINVSKQSMESIVFRSDKNIANGANTEFSFNFSNKRMNSLDQMFSYFNEMFMTAMSGSSM